MPFILGWIARACPLPGDTEMKKVAIAISILTLCLGYNRLYFFRRAGTVYFPEAQDWWSDYFIVPLLSIELCLRNVYVLCGLIVLALILAVLSVRLVVEK